jgi:hypothetical protein
MTRSRYPRSESVSDDRPTTPPPFDVEAFARQSITMDSDSSAELDPMAQRGPQGLPGRTTLPVALLTGTLQPPPSARVRRAPIASVGMVVLGIVVLGGASVIGPGRSRDAARRVFATAQAVAPAPNATVVEPPPDLPVGLTVVRTAATPSAVRALPPQGVPPPSVASASPGCKPPYVIDAETGKKHWKLECL